LCYSNGGFWHKNIRTQNANMKSIADLKLEIWNRERLVSLHELEFFIRGRPKVVI
jgi:hypothetical protein